MGIRIRPRKQGLPEVGCWTWKIFILATPRSALPAVAELLLNDVLLSAFRTSIPYKNYVSRYGRPMK